MMKYLIADPKYYTNDEKKFEEVLINVLNKQQIDIACFRDKESSNFKDLAKNDRLLQVAQKEKRQTL